MKLKSTLDGHDLKEIFIAGTAWLEKIVPDINALNVYPVPDGDCGTNMLFTLRSCLNEVALIEDGDVSTVSQAIAHGALMGARGNSGVILSQIWRGLANELKDKEIIDTGIMAQAFHEAADTAYHALSNPVEGTILTVMRDVASAARLETQTADNNMVSLFKAVVNAARASVMNTPNLLSVLKDAGVVDAGGHGLFTFLEGALLSLTGNVNGRSPELLSRSSPLFTPTAEVSHEEDFYGFCTQFMIKGENLSVADIRKALDNLGESLIVVGDEKTVRVHVHTHNPEIATRIGATFGSVVDKDINNMDEQHQDFLLTKGGRISSLPSAVIAVANGDGMVNVFADFGVAAIIPGGQTMNPSTMDILNTVERVDSENIILLPNNKNVIPSALLVRTLTEKNLKVIPTETIPQGIAALLEFVPEEDFDENVRQMTAAISTVKTIEITNATRSTKLNNLEIKEGQTIGLLDSELLAVGDTPVKVIFQILDKLDLAESSVLTLYYGKETDATKAEQIGADIRERYPNLEVGVVNSGQPHYRYIISLE